MFSFLFVKKLQNKSIQPLKLLVKKYLVKISNLEKIKNLSIKHLSSNISNTSKIGCSGSPSSVWTKGHSKECLCLEELLLILKARGEAGCSCPFPPGHPTAPVQHLREGDDTEGMAHGTTGLLLVLHCWWEFKQTVQLDVCQSWAGQKSLTLSSQLLSSKISN